LPGFGNIFYEATFAIRFLLSVTFIYEATGMFNKLEYIEACIADYELRIKNNKDLIKRYKKSLKMNKDRLNQFKTNKLPAIYINIVEGFIKQDKESIKFYEKSLKNKEAGLKKLKIKKFTASGKKFKVMKGGSS
ncbi:MAG: hypothetical protein JW976_05070, partial [Syntrophaceae bacterium]|nr:hypothetical protein [Syntrophaceae bacterium]